MKLIGTIIFHSILQGGPGFPVFTSYMYQYLTSDDMDIAISKLSIDDCSEQMKDFVMRIADSTDKKINEEDMSILNEAGITMILNDTNTWRIIQCLIVHDAFSKRKVA